MHIPMSSPDLTDAEIQAVNDVLTTCWLSIGPKIEQFEAEFARYIGTTHGIGVNSGTSGLHLAMIAAGIGEGDEVITPSFSFIASANCVVYERGTPVFVDIDPLTGNMDPACVEAAITERTKALSWCMPSASQRIWTPSLRSQSATISSSSRMLARLSGRSTRVGGL